MTNAGLWKLQLEELGCKSCIRRGGSILLCVSQDACSLIGSWSIFSANGKDHLDLYFLLLFTRLGQWVERQTLIDPVG
jgi:hypothetical protein